LWRRSIGTQCGRSHQIKAFNNHRRETYYGRLTFVQEQEPRSGVIMLGTILLIILIVILIGALPTWPYSSGWGYYPSGGFGLVVLIIVVLLLMGRI
jgi:hypothetical protein